MNDSQDPSFEAALLALLGRLFAAEIDAELLDVLRSDGVREVFEDIEAGCLDGIDLEGAAAEYSRLFILPKGVAPLAGAWSGTDDPDAASTVASLVKNVEDMLELELSEELAPDHVGTVLPLLGWLLENQEGAAEEFAAIAAAPWVPSFAKALETAAEMPIYRVVAKLLLAYFEEA